MKRPTDETALMTRYLLGDLSEDEQVRLEERFFADDESYRQLVALEDELRYDYAQGNLSARERGLFEKRFLTAPAEKQKVELAKAVLRKTHEAVRLQAAGEPKRSWWQALTESFTLRPVALTSAAAATAALCAVLFFSETVNLRKELNDLQSRGSSEQKAAQVALNQQKSRDEALNRELQQERNRREQLEQDVAKQKPSGVPLVLAFALAPGLQRDTEGPKRLRIPANADSVRLQLDVKAADRSAAFARLAAESG